MKKIKKAVFILSVMASSIYGNLALASSTTSTLNVNTIASASCVIRGNNVNFANIVPDINSTTNTISSTYMYLQCTKTTPYTLSFSTGGSGSFTQRTMAGTKTGNTDKLKYNLYDTDGSSILGDGTNGTFTLTGVGDGTYGTRGLYFSAPLNQIVTPDTYKDTLTVTIVY